ncbi:MAG: nucleotidyltransferase family protein [Bacteroidales bacterium]|nr:nucleotidyltransferase family protein [Bacteroidales bacterium]
MSSLASLDEACWRRIAACAKEQSVTGMLGYALESLPENTRIPDDVLYYLLSEQEITARAVRKKQAVSKAVAEYFEKKGLHPIIMKGPATAAFYPAPLMRSFGDIDLYFPGNEFREARTIASGMTGIEDAGDGSFHFNWEYVDVDVHSRYFDVHRPDKDLPAVPSPEATILMLSAHAMKHACGTGIGIRQICDVAMAFRSLEGRYDVKCVEEAFRKAGMARWQTLLSSFIINHLGIQAPLPKGKTVPDTPLLKIVEEGGNFGHHASGRKEALGKSTAKRKADTVKRFLKRLPFSLKYAPSETLRNVASLTVGNFKKKA